MATRLTSKGQVTIPKPVRDRLGLSAGSAVEFDLDTEGRVFLIKVGAKPEKPANRFDVLRGVAWPGMSTDEVMTLLRD